MNIRSLTWKYSLKGEGWAGVAEGGRSYYKGHEKPLSIATLQGNLGMDTVTLTSVLKKGSEGPAAPGLILRVATKA